MQMRFGHLRRRFDASGIARAHVVDLVIAVLSRRSKMFTLGWGDQAFLSGLRGRVSQADPPATVSIIWRSREQRGRIERRDGDFPSPLNTLPAEAGTAHLRALLREGNRHACVILAGSHDEGYRIRERVFGSLVARGVDLYLLENPYYGVRRVPGGLSAMKVSDHAMMALGMVLEARGLLCSLHPQYEKLAVAGYSMGGHMAAIAAAVTPRPVACAALATGASAGSIYTRGLMSWSVDYDRLAGEPGRRALAQQQLQGFFDAADITGFAPPLRPDASIILGCARDGYILRSETERLHQHWPGSTLRWLNAGHFSALLTSRIPLCQCVTDAIARL